MHERALGKRGEQPIALEILPRTPAGEFRLIARERHLTASNHDALFVFDVDDVVGVEAPLDARDADAEKRAAPARRAPSERPRR